MLDIKDLHPIGIGTWTISKADYDKDVKGLLYSFEKGQNSIECNASYLAGESLDVVAKFLKSLKREDIFVNVFITHGCSNIADIEQQIKTYLDKLNIDYFDCVTLHSPAVLKFDFNDYVKEIKRLQNKYKFLNIGYSNLSPEQFEKVQDHISFFEGLYNLENKINDDNGIITACQANNIPFYAYQPLRRNRTAKQNYKEVVSLAEKYSKPKIKLL